MTEKQLINGLKKEEAKYKVYFKKQTKDLALHFNKALGLLYFKPNYKVIIFEEKNKKNDNWICFNFKIPSMIDVFINDSEVQVYLRRWRENPLIMKLIHSLFKDYIDAFLYDGYKNKRGARIPFPHTRFKFIATLCNRLCRPGKLT